MKKLSILGAMGLAAAGPAHAQQSKSMEQILRELEALNARVGKLEQDNVQFAPRMPLSRRAPNARKRHPST